MRFEEVDPEKEPLASMSREPGERLVHDLTAGPLVHRASVAAGRHPVAVRLKAFDETEPAIERIRCDETTGREARLR